MKIVYNHVNIQKIEQNPTSDMKTHLQTIQKKCPTWYKQQFIVPRPSPPAAVIAVDIDYL